MVDGKACGSESRDPRETQDVPKSIPRGHGLDACPSSFLLLVGQEGLSCGSVGGLHEWRQEVERSTRCTILFARLEVRTMYRDWVRSTCGDAVPWMSSSCLKTAAGLSRTVVILCTESLAGEPV